MPLDAPNSPDDDGLPREGSPESGTPSLPPAPRPATPPTRLEGRGEGIAPLAFKQGAHPPFGIRWYGVTSLFGHLRGFVSRFIAAESVDSRDWMRPDPPAELLRAAVSELGAPRASRGAGSLVECLGRPLGIDFAADTGDDRDVSRAVGRMLAREYLLPNDEGPSAPASEGERVLPRGEILMMGGDIAYPVATADEIHERLVLPWNEALRAARDTQRARVLLGVPGNHDWYDGLDGFGRLFRKRVNERFIADDRARGSRLDRRLRKVRGRKVGLVARQLHLDEVSGLMQLLLGALETFRRVFTGRTAKKRRHLALRGYVPLQEASYFALPLARGLDLFGIDRQLSRLDFRQRAFFKRHRKEHPERAVLVLSADPALAYGERNEPGAAALEAVRLDLKKDKIFFISGDFHHYERRTVGPSCHIVAGGGGAFLHGTRINRAPSGDPDAAYPDARTSRELALGTPVKLLLGRSGWGVHLAMAVVGSLGLWVARTYQGDALLAAQGLMAAGAAIGLYFVAHAGLHRKPIAALSLPFGAAIGLLPFVLRAFLPRVLGAGMAVGTAVTLGTAALGTLLFGVFLMLLALLGLEHQQAFTVLGHPGFKHFVRLCVHPDGRIEGFVIGKDDTLVEGPPKLVDTFTWSPTRGTSTGAEER
ncbi:MAG: hypothetical protein JNM74_07060 [Myxococcales bacterium]|nr:hypothetical protein [Myxococcales bacterium]